MKILIVDDEPEVAEVLATSLTRQGHAATVAHSGQDALRVVKESPLDAMFLDVSMPGMNGLDVLAEVRRIKPSLAVVVITGHGTEDEIEEVRRMGVVEVITKPAALTYYQRALTRITGPAR
jgi:DNA-binding NtrC family response regulator